LTEKCIFLHIKKKARRKALEFQDVFNLGAYWEDRYHATAVESGKHLLKCLAYIDINMVRTGVVSHPSKWIWSGYNEIQNPKQRYAIINYKRLSEHLGIGSVAMLKATHAKLIDEALVTDKHERDHKWSKAIAVGNDNYIEHIRNKLGMKVIHRKTNQIGNGFELREENFSYNANFDPQNARLSQDNSLSWNIYL
jgi:hypothetical protein